MERGGATDWLAYEERISQLFADREIAEIDFEKNLQLGDLHGAAMASLHISIASLAMGDREDFYHHLQHAIYLTGSDVALDASDISDGLTDLPEMTGFEEISMPATPKVLLQNDSLERKIEDLRDTPNTTLQDDCFAEMATKTKKLKPIYVLQ